ncbi:hypothetical protein C0Q70_21061 [Pomacea canaliculata]|uniref:Sulfatase N-terminal domain-containing protein n=1 Tax=Pomacea canaliculata TaxID=400727 RepID=A0A2T7NBI9_POMCA|nr:hypothetical protein C0Q70_21061 [Pomacea canaliculata]
MELLSRLEQFHTKKTAPMSSATSLQSSHSPPPSSFHSASISPGDSVSHKESLTSVRSASLPGLNLSVFIFGFDSMSRMSWIRLLPRTRQYFLETLGGLELEGYNIVGDGTPAALLPILTGHQEEELPEARRGVPGAQPVDGHPWVWKDFKRHGYVTAYAEDMASIGTFELRMLGFKEQPTDHNMRLFYLAAERMYKIMSVLPGFNAPPPQLHALVRGVIHQLSHDCNNPVQSLDKDLTLFLRRLEENGHLNSTILILMADHGARFSHIRATTQGKLEERMPYFAFRFPPWVKQVHPQLIRNFETNTQRLTTPFDIHETLMEVLTYSGSGVGDISKRAISLFKEIPEHRSCSHAGVTPHWCACLKWDTPLICRILRDTFRQRPSTPEFVTSGSSDPIYEIYQVSFITQPGNGHFEVTCTLDTTSRKFSVASTDISRINTYGKDPDCVADSSPHLRPYCYCI